MSDEVKKILKSSNVSMLGVDEDVLLSIDLASNDRKLPVSNVESTLDQYRQYVKENDESNKYRLVFTINPVCSNVLYNHITEITSGVGTDLKFYGKKEKTVDKTNKYVNYKYGESHKVNREELIKDTGYSHNECGNFTYHCGIDIFNNHRFRNTEFVTVNGKGNQSTCKDYNTIEDTLREYDGSVVKIPTLSSGEKATHLYFRNTIKPFSESIQDNLVEKDGWFGFTNPTSLEFTNFKVGDSGYTINKVINNETSCAFIDLYPTRKEFTFIPYQNNTYRRIEKNWDYCITYPYKNYYNNELVSLYDEDKEIVANGIRCEFTDGNGNRVYDFDALINGDGSNEYFDVIICSRIRNNIKPGDYLNITLACSANDRICYTVIKRSVKVKSTGLGQYGQSYYFTVNSSDISYALKTLKNKAGGNGIDTANVDEIYCYVQRMPNGRACKYYFRKFRRLPNFKNTDVSNINEISERDIRDNCLNDFNSSLNKLGFGRNIYGDRMAQIVFNDDIDTTGIYDNLGRELHELYLTIIKTNKGHDKWYSISPKYNSSEVEISHCFGEVTSGIDMPWPLDKEHNELDKYNVHKIHGLNSDFISSAPSNAKVWDSTNRKYVWYTIPQNKTISYRNSDHVQIGFIDNDWHYTFRQDYSVETEYDEKTIVYEFEYDPAIHNIFEFSFRVPDGSTIPNDEGLFIQWNLAKDNRMKVGSTYTLTFDLGKLFGSQVISNYSLRGAGSLLPFPVSVDYLENNLTREGDNNGVFFGDIVELDETIVEEYVLEKVQHRFNTGQREDTTGEYDKIMVDEILSDDYDGTFKISTKSLLKEGLPANLAPEGYYYQAHYAIPIKEFSETVNEGQHTIVKFTDINTSNNIATATTDKNYFFNVSDEIYIYDKSGKKYVGVITEVSGSDFTNIKFTTDGLDIDSSNVADYNFFKPNKLKPTTAYDFDDGSGIYKWREFNSCENVSRDSELYDMVFTNGAHYIHKNINFFLKRQDPYGLFGLNYYGNEELQDTDENYLLLEQGGLEKDVTQGDYLDTDITLC